MGNLIYRKKRNWETFGGLCAIILFSTVYNELNIILLILINVISIFFFYSLLQEVRFYDNIVEVDNWNRTIKIDYSSILKVEYVDPYSAKANLLIRYTNSKGNKKRLNVQYYPKNDNGYLIEFLKSKLIPFFDKIY